MTFGYEGTEGARIHNPEGVGEILDVFQKHGHTEVLAQFLVSVQSFLQYCAGQIDSARTYTGGTSEALLGKVDHKGRGLLLETKLYPGVKTLLLSAAHKRQAKLTVVSLAVIQGC
jgi:aflatoxin B1 aldehyde reductase